MTIARRRSNKPAKPCANRGPSLREIVGDDTYQLWLEMLKRLVPDGRTHRLAVVLAAMLQYAVALSARRRAPLPEGSAASLLDRAVDDGDPDAYQELLAPLLKRLFKDAGVEWLRISKHIGRYSIIEAALTEFFAWYDYPWD